jgi:CheY-like chemotaxis protein
LLASCVAFIIFKAAMPNEHVLLIEDNNIDARLFELALRNACSNATLTRVPDVLSAVHYLRGIGIHANRTDHPLPYLVVIDLYLDSVSGMDLLKWMQKEPTMKGIIVLVLTGSKEDSDADSAYAHGANSYLKKSHDREALETSLTLLHQAWRRQGLLPPESAQQV